MPNVFQIKHAAERRAAKLKKDKPPDPQVDQPADGLMEVRRTAEGDHVTISGIYAERLQCAIYAMVVGLNDLVGRMAARGEVGSFSHDPIRAHHRIPQRPSRAPRRLLEDTDFGVLK